MRKSFSYMLIIAVACSIASCTKKNNNPAPTPVAPTAKVMFMNACINSPSVAVTVNGSVLPGDSSLGFMARTGYQSVTPVTGAAVAFELLSTRSNLSSGTFDLAANNYYSVFATGQVTSPSFLWTSDDLTAPASGTAKVRFINLSPDSLNESVAVDAATIDSNATFKTATGFSQIAAGSHKITAGDPTSLGSVVSTSQSFTAGKIYTVLLTGTQSGTGSAALQLTVLSNN